MQDQTPTPLSVQRQQQAQQPDLGGTVHRSWESPAEQLVTLALETSEASVADQEIIRVALARLCDNPLYDIESVSAADVEATRRILKSLNKNHANFTRVLGYSILALQDETGLNPIEDIRDDLRAGNTDLAKAMRVALGVIALALHVVRDPDHINIPA